MGINSNKRKIKILFIHRSLEVGGAEDLRFLTLRYLAQREDYDVKVCCIKNIGKIGEEIKKLGIEVFCLNKSSAPYNIFTTIALSSYLFKNRFDIVQTSLFDANFHGRIAAVLAGVPTIISEEHSEHYQYNSLKFLPYIWADRILARFTDKIICCSRNLMYSISEREDIALDKFFPLINTFNSDKLKIKKDAFQIKRELGLSEEDLIIGNIASLSPRKSQDVLIKAFSIINKRLPSSKLIFIGGEVPEYKQKLLGLACGLGLSDKILFLGRKDEIADYLNIVNIFVLSSVFEGIPLAMLEAMYMQTPVVATDVGGVSEVIINNKNGILVKPNNIEALANAIIELFSNKEKRIELARAGKETVLEGFTTERYVAQLEDLYARLYKIKITKMSNIFDAIYNQAIEEVPHLQPWKGHYLVRKTETEILANRFNFKKNYIGLEIGCGNAFQSVLLASASKKIFATDLFKENETTHSLGIIKAQDLINKLNVGNVTLISCSALSLPFLDNYFDFVFSSSALEHIKDRESALYEIKRVLKHNGYLILILPTHMPSIYAFPHSLLYILARAWRLFRRNDTKDYPNVSLANRFKKNRPSFPLPEPHGSYANIFEEIISQLPGNWMRLIESNGFVIRDSFSSCLMPWLLIEPFSTAVAAKIYSFTKSLNIKFSCFKVLRHLSYLVGIIALKNNEA